jgi:hypothetical protein
VAGSVRAPYLHYVQDQLMIIVVVSGPLTGLDGPLKRGLRLNLLTLMLV